MNSTIRAVTGVVPTKREVIAELKVEIDAWRSSYREHDGVIRDIDALHSIRCLEVALLVVRERKFPRGKG